MQHNFIKMQGCGNDYIYFNCMTTAIEDPEALSIRLSDRRFGIGGDGIILIEPSTIADAKMRIFNLDGSQGEMCGNGIRCVGKFLYDNGLLSKQKQMMTIETLSGIKQLELFLKDGQVDTVRVDMGKAILQGLEIPTTIDLNRIVAYPVEINQTMYEITCVSMGNPHVIVYMNDVASLPVEEIGPSFESFPLFPARINTEFIQVLDRNTLQMRVFERGSGETLACGTGACAAVVASVLNGYCDYDSDVVVHLLGGDLIIRYNSDGTVFMSGAAVTVFEGTINI